MQSVVPLAEYRRRKSRVYFTRQELSQLLSVYSTRVALGDWKDYAIDHRVGLAVFSVFKHTNDRPAYAIVKAAGPGGAAYTVFDNVRRLKRGESLAEVLPALGRPIHVVRD